MKTICMYSAQLHLAGGIESVVRDLYTVLPAHGIRVMAACERGNPSWVADSDYVVLPRERERRTVVWRDFVHDRRIDVVVFNHIADDFLEIAVEDVRYLRSLGVKCVKMNHASFDSPLVLSGEEMVWQNEEYVAKECDAMFTVSEADSKWWTACGFKAIKIQNPIHIPQRNAEVIRRPGEGGPTNLLWVGRQAEPKQPSAALAAFARAYKRTREIRLTMVGGTDAGWRGLKKEARRLGVSDQVEFLAARPDISNLWNAADIHLLSSVVESFCLVLAEAKAMGIPSVMFDIPYLELTASRKGVIIVPQDDLDAMAAAIVELVENKQHRLRLGAEARDSLAAFNNNAVAADWQKALAALETGEGFAEVSNEVKIFVNQIQFGWNRYCQKYLWLVRLQRDLRRLHLSLRPLSRFIETLVRICRRLKRGVAK